MTRISFRFPVWREPFGNEELYEWLIPLELRTAAGTFTAKTFLFDTGSGLTTLPLEDADRLHIPYDLERPVAIRGTTGTGRGYVAPMWFSLAGMPEFQFECLCCFSPSAPRELLSLRDVIRHFRTRTLLPSHLHPLGSLILQLHGRHKGQPRSA